MEEKKCQPVRVIETGRAIQIKGKGRDIPTRLKYVTSGNQLGRGRKILQFERIPGGIEEDRDGKMWKIILSGQVPPIQRRYAKTREEREREKHNNSRRGRRGEACPAWALHRR